MWIDLDKICSFYEAPGHTMLVMGGWAESVTVSTAEVLDLLDPLGALMEAQAAEDQSKRPRLPIEETLELVRKHGGRGYEMAGWKLPWNPDDFKTGWDSAKAEAADATEQNITPWRCWECGRHVVKGPAPDDEMVLVPDNDPPLIHAPKEAARINELNEMQTALEKEFPGVRESWIVDYIDARRGIIINSLIRQDED